MSIDYTKYRAALESLYEDKATISGYEDVLQPDGATRKQPVTIATDQPCRLSQQGLARDGQTDAQNDIRYDTKLFISPDVQIKQGYLVAVLHASVLRTYKAGESFPYPSHQEVILLREGQA